MKQHYVDLMQLHGSLDLGDRRRLRQQLAAAGAAKELVLMEALGTELRLSESAWLKGIGAQQGWTASELAAARAGLVRAIQSLLLTRHEERDPIMQVLKLLREARSLYLESYAVPAMRLLHRAATLAHTHEEYELLALVRHHMQIVSQDIGAGAVEAAPDGLPSWPQILDELRQCHGLRSQISEVTVAIRRRDADAESTERLLAIRDQMRMFLTDRQLPFRPRAIGLVLQGVVESMTGGKEEALAIREALHLHYLSHPALIQLWLGPYAGNLYNIVGTLSQLGRWDEVDDYLQQLSAIPKDYAKLVSRHVLLFLSARTLNLRMLFHLQRRQHDQGMAAFREVESRLEDHGMSSIQEFHLGVYLAAAVLYLEQWQHQRARAVVRTALERYHPDLRKDHRLILRVIEVISLVRDDEGEYVNYKIGNLLRPLRRAQEPLRRWGMVAQLAGKLYFAPDARSRKAILQATTIWSEDESPPSDLLLERAREWIEASF